MRSWLTDEQAARVLEREAEATAARLGHQLVKPWVWKAPRSYNRCRLCGQQVIVAPRSLRTQSILGQPVLRPCGEKESGHKEAP